MKLYATVSADKTINGKQTTVSKGQGGNKFINIDLNIDGNEYPRFRLHLNNFDDKDYNLVVVDLEKPFPNSTIFETKIKGKKQQTANNCRTCGYSNAMEPHECN